MRLRFTGLLGCLLVACSSTEGGSGAPTSGNNSGGSAATSTGDAQPSGGTASTTAGTTTSGTSTSGTTDNGASATQNTGGTSNLDASGGAMTTSQSGSTNSAAGGTTTATGGDMNAAQGGSQVTGGGAGQGGSTSSAGAAMGGAGTAGAGMGSGGSTQAPTFDRTAACTGGPYAAHPLESSDMLTASSISGTETDNTSGFQIFEGPVWLDGALYFSHISGDNSARVRRLVPPSSVEEAVVGADSNGLAIDQNGNLVGATHGNQSISRIDLAGMMVVDLITSVNGTPAADAPAFNSPNDLAVRSDGVIYFTDPNWQNDDRPSVGDRKLYVVTPDGAATAVDTPFYSASSDPDGGPNGVALSIDEQTLYVSGNGGTRIATYPVNADGSLGAPGDFPMAADYVPAGDGMTLDCAGNLYMAGDGVIFVFSESGEELGRIQPGDGQATNAAFGGTGSTTLYVTSMGQGIPQISSIDIGIPGLPY